MIHILTNRYEQIDPLFGRSPRPIELDMGCGKGGFSLQLAERYPERLVLASDVMLGRLRRVAGKVERAGLTNIELLRASNIELAGFQLPSGSVSRIHWLCPDPWPKPKHRHKRLLTHDFLTRLARVLPPEGVLHLSSDHQPYLEEAAARLEQLPFFAPAPDTIRDVVDLETEFEKLWTSRGRSVPHLGYVRLPHPHLDGNVREDRTTDGRGNAAAP